MIPPREEDVIREELEDVEEELRELEGAGGGFDTVRERLEGLRDDVEAANMDSARPLDIPAWAANVGAMSYRPPEILRRVEAALAELDVCERQEPRAIDSRLLMAACEGIVDPFDCVRPDADRVEALLAKLSDLNAELQERQRGPGEPQAYRLLSGSHGTADGRTIRPGGILELNRWEAARLGADRVERVEEAA